MPVNAALTQSGSRHQVGQRSALITALIKDPGGFFDNPLSGSVTFGHFYFETNRSLPESQIVWQANRIHQNLQ
jgi:hypothetical protein